MLFVTNPNVSDQSRWRVNAVQSAVSVQNLQYILCVRQEHSEGKKRIFFLPFLLRTNNGSISYLKENQLSLKLTELSTSICSSNFCIFLEDLY